MCSSDLQRLLERRARGGVVGVNIGANKDSANRIADYVKGIEVFEDVANYITINISSPNTPGLRNLQTKDDLQHLLSRMNATRKTKKPMLLKIAPDLTENELSDVAQICGGGAVDGVIISNTTLARDGLTSSLAKEAGGLSGRPLFERSTHCLKVFHQMTGGKIPLIGVGGIHDATSAKAKLAAGASLVQLYSALVYQGPALVREICSGLERA